jgi:phenylacetate-CoA ligase
VRAAPRCEEGTGAYERLRARHIDEAHAHLGGHLERITWHRERLRRVRRQRLRSLIRFVQRASPWHRARLGTVDAGRMGVEGLAHVPPMTKDDLMANFDRIVTDRRVTLRLVEDHLASVRGDAYLLDRYHAVASGGSSGRRGVFIYDWEAWRDCYLGFMRHLLRAPAPSGRPDVMALVAAGHPTHFSATLPRTFSGAGVRMHRIPVTCSTHEIVRTLNELQPTILGGYPSALRQLAFVAREGALRITPRQIFCSSEPLLPEARAALAKTWGAPVLNCWGTSEGGPMGAPCALGHGMHLSEDMHIVEPVDGQGRPVPLGALADKVYVTNLFNPVLPLIRYELGDEVRLIKEKVPVRVDAPARRRHRGPYRRRLLLRGRRGRSPSRLPHTPGA